MDRHEVQRTARISVTEDLIHQTDATNVLEIGAGDYSFEYIKKGLVQTWVKVDFAPPCDFICNLNAPELKLPFSECTFNLIVCTEVLEHLLWPQQLLKEMHRILTLDGNIIVSVPNIASLSYRIAWLLGRIPSCAASGNLPPELGPTAYNRSDGSMIGGHVIDFDLNRLQGLLNLTGFKTVTTRGSGIVWHRQILSHWLVPPPLASNIICLASKM